MRDIAIVGAGVAGISAFVQLVREAGAGLSSVTLIDPNAPGTGPVFGDPDPDLLCNTSAGICSLLPEAPSDFVGFCAEHARPVGDADLVPRSWIGEYARVLFRDHSAPARARGVGVAHEPGRVHRVTRTGGGYRLRLGDGRERTFSHVIVAVGLGGPVVPDGFAALTSHPRWTPSPYPSARLRRRVGDAPSRVLVVGGGLSAVDAALLLCRDGHHVTLASRSGLLPAVRARILPSPRPLPSLEGIVGLEPDDPLLHHKVGRAVVEAVRVVSPLPLRRQLSRSTDPVRRLREETALAEAGLCHWQDVLLSVFHAASAWSEGLPLPDREAALAPVRPVIWRYVTSLALPNARKLLAHIDAGKLTLDTYDPARVRAHDGGFEVASRDGRVRVHDHVVAAAGFHMPALHHDADGVHLVDPPPSAVPLTAIDGDLRLHLDGRPERIWVIGPASHVRRSFVNFLTSVAVQARAVARQIGEGS
ncbi:FAD-NAD(P)-binding [Marinactinospora thermotolerans DSM 45154]|uniref:FAD-NAD(P)-binding n=1 Tax=Marinactinospora thermotolerans DSM 45154 TaxID=1122192 RepID=A0A1T4QEH5_9ACTN|nr:FAD/NAD(P)-binding protein [Marinactinospora thermotolerans]SKA02210.1 FAD-NAD(P)-binding [Marinactinospora thermotolerans DSM 45154]